MEASVSERCCKTPHTSGIAGETMQHENTGIT
jgi:hypothetical protein